MARILVTGGGTGGHFFPALAVARELVTRGHAVAYAGSRRGIEARRAWEEPFPRFLLPVSGYRRGRTASLLTAASSLVRALPPAWRLLRSFGPQAVVGFGGYASAPCLLCARLAGLPYLLHESNAEAGLVTRALARSAARLLVAFPPRNPRRSPRGLVVTGTPVRMEIAGLSRAPAARRRAKRRFGLPPSRRVLLLMPGSQGSAALNDLVLRGLDEWAKVPRLSLLWTTGERDFPSVDAAARRARLPCAVFPFLARVEDAYAAADVFLGRAGSSTLAELACAGLPAALVPFPAAAGGHQRGNARVFEEHGAAVAFAERDLTPGSLVAFVSRLLTVRTLTRMARAASGLARPGAASAIAHSVEEVIEGV